jgi:hypothetical protein
MCGYLWRPRYINQDLQSTTTYTTQRESNGTEKHDDLPIGIKWVVPSSDPIYLTMSEAAERGVYETQSLKNPISGPTNIGSHTIA